MYKELFFSDCFHYKLSCFLTYLSHIFLSVLLSSLSYAYRLKQICLFLCENDVLTCCDNKWNISRIFCVLTDDSIDSGLETETPDRMATYIMMDARDRLDITLTPAGLQVLHDLATAFTRRVPDIPPAAYHGLEAPLSLQNDLGPWAKVTMLSRAEVSYNPILQVHQHHHHHHHPLTFHLCGSSYNKS